MERSQLDKVAEELWDVIKPDMPIDPEWDEAKLTEMIIQAASLLAAGDEILSGEAFNVLTKLDVIIPAGVTNKDEKEEKAVATAKKVPAKKESSKKKKSTTKKEAGRKRSEWRIKEKEYIANAKYFVCVEVYQIKSIGRVLGSATWRCAPPAGG